jgi:hypothetical protein
MLNDKLYPDRRHALRTLAKSMFRELSAGGYTEREVVQFVTELLAQLNAHLGTQRQQRIE